MDHLEEWPCMEHIADAITYLSDTCDVAQESTMKDHSSVPDLVVQAFNAKDQCSHAGSGLGAQAADHRTLNPKTCARTTDEEAAIPQG